MASQCGQNWVFSNLSNILYNIRKLLLLIKFNILKFFNFEMYFLYFGNDFLNEKKK